MMEANYCTQYENVVSNVVYIQSDDGEIPIDPTTILFEVELQLREYVLERLEIQTLSSFVKIW